MTRADYHKEIEQTSLAIRAEMADAQAILDRYEGKASGERLTLRLARLASDAAQFRAELAQERAAIEAERTRREKAERALRLVVESAEQDGDASVIVPRVAYVLARRTLEGRA